MSTSSKIGRGAKVVRRDGSTNRTSVSDDIEPEASNVVNVKLEKEAVKM